MQNGKNSSSHHTTICGASLTAPPTIMEAENGLGRQFSSMVVQGGCRVEAPSTWFI